MLTYHFVPTETCLGRSCWCAQICCQVLTALSFRWLKLREHTLMMIRSPDSELWLEMLLIVAQFGSAIAVETCQAKILWSVHLGASFLNLEEPQGCFQGTHWACFWADLRKGDEPLYLKLHIAFWRLQWWKFLPSIRGSLAKKFVLKSVAHHLCHLRVFVYPFCLSVMFFNSVIMIGYMHLLMQRLE